MLRQEVYWSARAACQPTQGKEAVVRKEACGWPCLAVQTLDPLAWNPSR